MWPSAWPKDDTISAWKKTITESPRWRHQTLGQDWKLHILVNTKSRRLSERRFGDEKANNKHRNWEIQEQTYTRHWQKTVRISNTFEYRIRVKMEAESIRRSWEADDLRAYFSRTEKLYKLQSGVRNMMQRYAEYINPSKYQHKLYFDLEGRLWQNPWERETKGPQKGRAHWCTCHKGSIGLEHIDLTKPTRSPWTKISQNFLLRGIASIAKHKIEILQWSYGFSWLLACLSKAIQEQFDLDP